VYYGNVRLGVRRFVGENGPMARRFRKALPFIVFFGLPAIVEVGLGFPMWKEMIGFHVALLDDAHLMDREPGLNRLTVFLTCFGIIPVAGLGTLFAVSSIAWRRNVERRRRARWP
jgi:hypothetical protein